MAEQKAAVEELQNLRFPVRSFDDAMSAGPFVQACMGAWCDHIGVDKGEVYHIQWANATICGSNALHCMEDALGKTISPTLASSPERSCALVMAPNVGRWGNQFHEDEIMKHADAIEQLFSNPDLRIIYRRVALVFAEDTVPSQSSRPAAHPGWMLLSDQMVGPRGPSPVFKAEFCKSALWVRKSVSGVPMLSSAGMVDSTVDEVVIAAPHRQLESKPARRRQWLAGWKLISKIHDVLMTGMGLDSRAVATWTDVFAYDHSLCEAIMHKTDAKWPREQVVSTVWSTSVFRTSDGENKAHLKGRVEKWMKFTIRRKLQQAAADQVLTIDNWVSIPAATRDSDNRPTYDLNQFTLCYPSSAKLLPFRQSFLDAAAAKFTVATVKALYDAFVAAHNEKWNPTGTPHTNARPRPAADPGTERAAKRPRTINPPADGPSTVSDLERKKGKCAKWEFQKQQLLATMDGELWVWGLETDTLGQEDALCLIWGRYNLGAEGEALLAEQPLRSFNFEINDVSTEGGYSTKEQTGDKAVSPVLRPLSEFLDLLETQVEIDIDSTPFACHKVKASVERDGAGDVTGRSYTIQHEKTCVFKPEANPRRTDSTWGDAGSLLCLGDGAGQWDWQTGLHVMGNLRMYHYLQYGNTEQHQGILPHKPAIYLENPVAIEKGKLIRLA